MAVAVVVLVVVNQTCTNHVPCRTCLANGTAVHFALDIYCGSSIHIKAYIGFASQIKNAASQHVMRLGAAVCAGVQQASEGVNWAVSVL